MSKSARKSRSTDKQATAPAIDADAHDKPPAHPWVIDGIDYGPAFAAVHDLAAWAFDLAARDVAEWAEGRRRVRSARGYILARLQGKRPRHAPTEDVLFTAGLLARIFDLDLGLPMTEMVSIFDELGLPTEMVPLQMRAAANTRRPQQLRISSLRRRAAAAPPPPGPIDYYDAFLRFHNAA